MLLVLLLGIADFGRVFATGISVEASARNAAEVAAQEYLRNPPAPFTDPDTPAPTPGDNDYYSRLHTLAAQTACDELRSQPNSGYDPGTRTCAGIVVQVCVHDSADPLCSAEPSGFASPASMPECTSAAVPPVPTQEAESPELRYVQVRICYRFTTLFNLQNIDLPFGWGLSLGNVYLQRDRTFTVANY